MDQLMKKCYLLRARYDVHEVHRNVGFTRHGEAIEIDNGAVKTP